MSEEEKCPFGCIFYPDSNTLYGDCRAPQSKDCHVGKIMDTLSFTCRTINDKDEDDG
jgi:hypothetical protein